jgi:hypothetical protein
MNGTTLGAPMSAKKGKNIQTLFSQVLARFAHVSNRCRPLVIGEIKKGAAKKG